jgi:hypothetical protein
VREASNDLSCILLEFIIFSGIFLSQMPAVNWRQKQIFIKSVNRYGVFDLAFKAV